MLFSYVRIGKVILTFYTCPTHIHTYIMISIMLLIYCLILGKIRYISLGLCPYEETSKLNQDDLQVSFRSTFCSSVKLYLSPHLPILYHHCPWKFSEPSFLHKCSGFFKTKASWQSVQCGLTCVKLSYSSLMMFLLFSTVFFICLWANG